MKALKQRKQVDNNFKWRVNDLVANDELWKQDHEEIKGEITAFVKLKEDFTSSASNLLKVLNERSRLGQKLETLLVYAIMKFHEDQTNATYQGLQEQAKQTAVKLQSVVSFIEPALLSMDEVTLNAYIDEEEGLKLYRHYFEDLLRQKEHILSPEMEEMLAEAHEIGSAASDIYDMIADADMKFGEVKDENGETVELTHGRYSRLIESKNRDVRKQAFKTMYDAYIKQKNTIAAAYNASVKADIFFSSQRKYGSAQEAALSGYNIPIEVYTNLIEAVHEALPAMHRYVRLRKKALGVDELHMYDVYTPIIAAADTKCDYDKAKDTVLKALAVLGDDYVTKVREAYNSGWIDVYENEGKHSGAYSWGAYGAHPFVLLNYEDKIADMFTLAHELGHAMHSYYTWSTQPYLYGDYTIFLAEVASTVNETLLMNYLRKTVDDKTMSLYLINYFLDQFKGTLIRQTMFAEFEMLTHKMAEEGQPLTTESLSVLYKRLTALYFGDGIVIDDEISFEWSRIPHFYSAFYVYQYSTGFSAAVAFARAIEKDPSAVEKYKQFLKSGSSDYSINILKKAGVDMSRPEPVREALKLFEELVGDMERLLA
ncbi:MAG: oligoendopeptidase F [Clostridiales bacterium]|nr:oligoendopeptidase F [Clostridiales bacterium]